MQPSVASTLPSILSLLPFRDPGQRQSWPDPGGTGTCCKAARLSERSKRFPVPSNIFASPEASWFERAKFIIGPRFARTRWPRNSP